MKLFLLGGATLLALAASEPAARATLFDFTYTGSLVTFTVPTTDTYQILAFGAQGGSGSFGDGFPVVSPGGQGAEIGGDFSLTAGEVLQIAVGGAGSDGGFNGGGGGGGSFVAGPGNTPLVIAGGGGGAGAVPSFFPAPGGPGLTGPDGGSGDNPFANGGSNGNGGGGGCFIHPGGGGGGGFFSAGGDSCVPGGGIGGGAFPDLTGGPFGGGFGGGGGDNGGGGGGGYSGGGGGAGGNTGTGPGGGGGSFDAGIDQILVADFRTGSGEVVITELAAAVPEPASILLVSAGLAGLAAIRRRRRHT
jgi:PEP-CTERM motif-containing protein